MVSRSCFSLLDFIHALKDTLTLFPSYASVLCAQYNLVLKERQVVFLGWLPLRDTSLFLARKYTLGETARYCNINVNLPPCHENSPPGFLL